MKIVYLKVFLMSSLLLFSCTKRAEIETIDSSEILPQAKENQDIIDIDNVVEEDSIQETPFQITLSEKFPSILFDQENELKERDVLFMPNRLGYDEKNETYFVKDSIPFHLIEWSFADSAKTINAFYNWLDCFGSNCKSIRIEESVNVSKEAFTIWVIENKLVYLASSQSIKEKDWELLFENTSIKHYFTLNQSPRGKIQWRLPSE